MPVKYDFSDEQIRRMVEDNHFPEEPDFILYVDGDTVVTDSREIKCYQDHQPWPCTVVKALREWNRGVGEDIQVL